MTTRTIIQAGQQHTKDPSEITRWTFDWSERLGPAGILEDAGTFTVAAVTPREAPVSLVIDAATVSDGAQGVSFRVSGGRRGTTYTVAHRVVTREAPAQTLERSFSFLVEDL